MSYKHDTNPSFWPCKVMLCRQMSVGFVSLPEHQELVQYSSRHLPSIQQSAAWFQPSTNQLKTFQNMSKIRIFPTCSYVESSIAMGYPKIWMVDFSEDPINGRWLGVPLWLRKPPYFMIGFYQPASGVIIYMWVSMIYNLHIISYNYPSFSQV